jgi:hypothetical protein
METAVRTAPSGTHFNPIYFPGSTNTERPPSSAKNSAAKKPKEKPAEPKKSIWQSVFFGLATGVLGFLIKVLPEKIGNFLSQVFSSMVKADNPFIPEVE